MKATKPIDHALFGMLAGGLAGFFLSYPFDRTRGWDPYGWWFPTTVIAAAMGGLAGVLIWGVVNKKPSKRNVP